MLEMLRPTVQLLPPAANPKPYYRAAMFAEYLGISPSGYAIFTGANPLASWFKLYGFTSEAAALGALRSAKTLSQRLGISYVTLVDLVRTGFVNPRLDALIILSKLGIESRDLFRYQKEPGYPELTEAEKNAFEKRLAGLGDSVQLDLKGIKDKLDTSWKAARPNEILLLVDPDTGCNFDLTSLKYGDGKDADALALLKINLFVRLWKKLGWTIEETDRALQVLLPKNSLPLTGANLSAAMTSALIYFAHLKTLTERLKVGQNGRLKLL